MEIFVIAKITKINVKWIKHDGVTHENVGDKRPIARMHAGQGECGSLKWKKW